MSSRLLAFGAALALAGAALADQTVPQTASTPLALTNWTKSLTIGQFDPSQGHLDSVVITFNGNISSFIQLENTDPIVKDWSATGYSTIVLTGTDGNPLVSLSPTIPVQGGTLGVFDGSDDGTGTSGVTVSNILASASGTKTLTGDDAVAAFIGSGTITLPVGAVGGGEITTSGNSSQRVLTRAASGISVVYNYTPYALGSLGDYVWFDANNNGIQDANEKGVSGVTVKLYDGNGNYLFTDVTDDSGHYLFDKLPAGDYRVQFVKPTNYAWSFTKTDAGTNDNVDSDANPVGLTSVVHLDAGQNRLDVDAGLVGCLCLGDRVWKDYNGNGIQDSGEPGVPGVAVHLLDSDGDVLADTTTDSNGYYKFTNLPAGDYVVDFDAPNGYGFTKQTSSATYKAVDSNPDPTTGLAPVSLTSNDLTIDAGLIGAQKIGDTVWLDCDGDGKFDEDQGEKGIKNVRVTLYGYLNNDNTPDVVLTTTTDANGKYIFNGLYPGTYVVAVNPNDVRGLTQTYDLDGVRTANYAIGTLKAGMDNLDFDFGYKPSSSCGSCSHTYWQCNPNCWPKSCITIGGKCHTKSQACAWMKIGNCSDKTVCVYQRLCAAKLNVGKGCDQSKVYTCGRTTCSVKDAIKCVDAWMSRYPVGCNVSGNSSAWSSISDCYGILDKFCSN